MAKFRGQRTLALGSLLVFAGLAKGIDLRAAGRSEDANPGVWAVSANEDPARSDGPGSGGRTCPIVNVDGTPMLDDYIDVAGKVYGDSGTTFNHDFAAGMWDGGSAGGLDSHHVGGSDW